MHTTLLKHVEQNLNSSSTGQGTLRRSWHHFFIADNWRTCHSAYQCWASVWVLEHLSECVSSCSYSGFPVLNAELLKPLEGADPSSAGMASRHSSPASPLAICRRSKQVSCANNNTWNCYFPFPKCPSCNGLWSEMAIKVFFFFNWGSYIK